MRWSIPLTLAAVMLVGACSTAEGHGLRRGKQLKVHMLVFEGDPLGSREALKMLAESSIVTEGDRPFSYFSGSETVVPDGPRHVQYIEIGRAIKGKLGPVKDGKVSLDITLSSTVREGPQDRIQLKTECRRTLVTVRVGEVVKLRWGKGGTAKEMWAERL